MTLLSLKEGVRLHYLMFFKKNFHEFTGFVKGFSQKKITHFFYSSLYLTLFLDVKYSE